MTIAKVKLSNPITRGEQSIEELTLREPSTGDLRGLKLLDVMQMDAQALIKLVPRISEPVILEEDVARMKMGDLTRVSQGVLSFFDDSVSDSPTT